MPDSDETDTALPMQSFALPVHDWRRGGCAVQSESALHAASGLSHAAFTHLPQSLPPKPEAGGGVAAAGAAAEAAGAADEESGVAADAAGAGDDESLGAAELSGEELLAVPSVLDGDSAGLLEPPQATTSTASRNVFFMRPLLAPS